MKCKECGKDETQVTFRPKAKTCDKCYRQHRQYRSKTKGICIGCSKPSITEIYCQDCANKQRALSKAYHQRRRAAGICCECSGIAATGKSRCRPCQLTRNIALYKKISDLKLECIALLGGKCLDCGLISNVIAVYDFHHLDGN